MSVEQCRRLFQELTRAHDAAQFFENFDFDAYEIVTTDPRLPEWWTAHNNFMLRPKLRKTSCIPNIFLHPTFENCSNFIFICNDQENYGVLVWGDRALLFVSPHAHVAGADIALGSGCVYVGPQVRHTARLKLNCRNGGKIVLVGDILIASDVQIQTDDCHTLYRVADGKRTNPYGGSIVVDRHVWIGQESFVMGNSRIERDSIVGARSFVRGSGFAPNVVLAGTPARVVSTGVNWDFRDLPPDVVLGPGAV